MMCPASGMTMLAGHIILTWNSRRRSVLDSKCFKASLVFEKPVLYHAQLQIKNLEWVYSRPHTDKNFNPIYLCLNSCHQALGTQTHFCCQIVLTS